MIFNWNHVHSLSVGLGLATRRTVNLSTWHCMKCSWGFFLVSVFFRTGTFENSTRIIDLNWQYQIEFHFGVSGTNHVVGLHGFGFGVITTSLRMSTSLSVRLTAKPTTPGDLFSWAASNKFRVLIWCLRFPNCFEAGKFYFCLYRAVGPSRNT